MTQEPSYEMYVIEAESYEQAVAKADVVMRKRWGSLAGTSLKYEVAPDPLGESRPSSHHLMTAADVQRLRPETGENMHLARIEKAFCADRSTGLAVVCPYCHVPRGQICVDIGPKG